MKTKKLIVCILSVVMLISCTAYAGYYDAPNLSDIFNNDILEIVATVKDAPSEPSADAVLIGERVASNYNFDTDSYSVEIRKEYSDGSYTTTKLFDTNEPGTEKATKYYPAYLTGDTTGKYVQYVRTEERLGDDYYQDIYLVDTTGEEITKTLIGSMISDYDAETYSETISLFSAKEENGTIVRTPTTDKPLTSNEFEIMKKGTLYNDGLRFDRVSDSEAFSLKGFCDINNNIYFEDAQISYFNFFYNLGYLVTVSNNGGVLDYSVEDYEKQRVFDSSIENVFTGEVYSFTDVDITNLYDSGYVRLTVKDEARNETQYIAKLKKNAIIKVMLNDEKVLFDVLPTITDGRTLVPLRAIFEALGAKVEWNGETQTITATKDDKTVVLTIGSNEMTVDGETKTLDVSAQIIDGRTLVPVRAISEAFGCSVDWNDAERTVIINY